MKYFKFEEFKKNPSLINAKNGMVCDGCGSKFIRARKRLNSSLSLGNNKAYCSHSCHSESLKKYIDVNCDNCNNVFRVKPAYLKRSKRNFCCRDCQNQYHSKISVISELIEILGFDINL